jgi:hypothetical protein
MLLSSLAFTNIAQAAIIGVDLEAGNGSPTNWNSYSFTDGTTITNIIDEANNPTGVNFNLTGVNASWAGDPPDSNTIPERTSDTLPDLTNVCCDILFSSGSGGSDLVTATWSGLLPGTSYNYWFLSSYSADQDITVIGSTTFEFLSPDLPTPTNGGTQVINDTKIESITPTFESYAFQMQASATGTIAIEIRANDPESSKPVASGFALELAPVPVPAAAWLFGSGLIGLVGIARRNKGSLSG